MQLNETLTRPAPQSLRRWQSIDAVLSDGSLDVDQKRAILSSWASDLFAVESCPWLRSVPGVPEPLRVGDIFAGLRALDDDPPRGGACVRMLPRARPMTDARMRLRPRVAEMRHAR